MVSKYKIFIYSEDPDKLLPFYRDTLGFEVVKHLNYPKDYGYTLKVSDGYEIWLAKHSEVQGYNKEPVRHMFNFYTDKLQETFNKIKSIEGVKILQEPIEMSNFIPEEKRSVFTILDPEGNCLQFMGS